MKVKYSFPWHDENCTARSTTKAYFDPENGNIRFFCETHHQWTAELPVKAEITYTYANGKTVKVIQSENA